MPGTATRRIRLGDIAATPWKNGGGVTREIATGGRPDGGAGWGWRVSLAEVAADGPFSTFEGTDRVIAVIEGAGMDLQRPDGTVLPLEPFQPVKFCGEDPLDGRLRGGPVRDLNVMVRRGLFVAEMEVRCGPCSLDVATSEDEVLMLCHLAGHCAVETADGQTHNLDEAEFFIQEGRGPVALENTEGSRTAVIRILRG